MSLTPDDPRHGKASSYRNHACRCPACTAAHNNYAPGKAARERYRRRRGQEPRQWGRTHGIRCTYIHGCRCSACTDAARVYMADYRARRRAS